MKKTEEQIGIRKRTAKMYIEENKELKKELKKYKHYYDRDKEELMESCYALKKENRELKIELWMYQSLFKDKIEPYWCWIWENVTEEDIEEAIKKYLNTNQK